jgi:uncharacterized protein YjbI with pentapeptide repeats
METRFEPMELRKRSDDFDTTLRSLVKQYTNSKLEDKQELNKAIRALLQNRPLNDENKLVDLDLSNLDLRGLDLSFTTIRNVKFNKSDLRGCSFCGRDRRRRSEIKADFTKADCRGTDFTNADVREATYKDTKIEDAKFLNAWVSRNVLEFLVEHAQCDEKTKAKISLKSISLENVDISGMDLTSLYLEGVYFCRTNVNQVRFNRSDIKGAIFTHAKKLLATQLADCFHVGDAYLPPTINEKLKKQERVVSGMNKISMFFTPKRKRKVDEALEKKSEVDDRKNNAPVGQPPTKRHKRN